MNFLRPDHHHLSPDERFDDLYMPEPMSGCWLWLGCVHMESLPYGQFYAHGKPISAHRYSFERFKGKLKPGDEVMHVCDNPACCNPDHLRRGSHADNMEDMTKKGRRAVGEKHGCAILTAEQVAWLRANTIPGHPEFGFSALGRKFGRSHNTIADIFHGRRWSHSYQRKG